MCASNCSSICLNVSLSTSGFVSYTSVTSIRYVSRVPSPASTISPSLDYCSECSATYACHYSIPFTKCNNFLGKKCVHGPVFLLLFTFSITVKNYFGLVLMFPRWLDKLLARRAFGATWVKREWLIPISTALSAPPPYQQRKRERHLPAVSFGTWKEMRP